MSEFTCPCGASATFDHDWTGDIAAREWTTMHAGHRTAPPAAQSAPNADLPVRCPVTRTADMVTCSKHQGHKGEHDFTSPDPTPAPDDLVAALQLRILSEHGGPSGVMHGWNLTHGDSIMHREAAAEIVALRERIAELERERRFYFDKSIQYQDEIRELCVRAERAEADNAKLRACVAELVDNKIGTKKWFDAMRVAREFLEGTK